MQREATNNDATNSGATNSKRAWRFVAVDHVQLAMPAGAEALAREFYVGALGFTEAPKPPVMAARGGCWFEFGSVHIHLGVEDEFRPARKAHPAVVVDGLDALLDADSSHEWLQPRWSDDIAGTRRCHVDDPFGNRIELIDGSTSTPNAAKGQPDL